MSYAVEQPVPWPVPPDWSRGVRESLDWLTNSLQAKAGAAQKRRLRQNPRRGFEFEVIAAGVEQQLIDIALGDQGGREWQLPIYHDIQQLQSPLSSASTTIPCRTTGFEFIDGGRALLWLELNLFEIVDIDTVEADSLELASATSLAWPAHARLYPLRAARIEKEPQTRSWNDRAGKRTVNFIVTEPCDWPAVSPPATYRDYPVLEVRSDEGEDPSSGQSRMLETFDAGAGPVAVFDWVGVPFRTKSHRWLLSNRAAHSAMRSLLYALAGRWLTLWVPTWTADLTLATTISSGSTSLVVTWCGYTVFGRGQWHCRDIRIELIDGTVFYRRITGWSESTTTETLTLSSALGVSVAPSAVRLISYLVLSEQATDKIEIDHVTDADGITRASTSFKAVKRDV